MALLDDEWRRLAERELGRDPEALVWHTPEGISVKPLYTASDLEGLVHLGGLPGQAPFARGSRATMYAGRPWTIRQYAGFSTAEQSNAIYRQALAAGQQGLSVAFDLPTQRGYDSDHPQVAGEVGKVGVTIDTVEDMRVLFDGIPLDQVSVSMTMNGAVVPILAAFIVAAEEQGVACDRLSGTIQNDILKEFMVRNTYIYPPEPSMRIVVDIIAYAAAEMPRFNPVSISGYHMQEAGATLVQELAFTLANGRDYVRAALRRGLDVDAVAGRLSFFFAVGMDFFMEAAKLRAARILWARMMDEFAPKQPASRMLRMHCQTSGASLQEQDPTNNIVRTAYEAMAAVLGGTQSLHTNAFDEAIALPTEASARLARNTQLILQQETGITRVVDPLAGSYYVESLTAELVEAAWALIEEVEALGGMTQAVADGLPKRRILEAAVKRQAEMDRCAAVIVGVNRYRTEPGEPVAIRDIDTIAVRRAQISQLEAVKRRRDSTAVSAALEVLRSVARSRDGNVLAAAITAARARATVGEISDALRDVFGSHVAKPELCRGVYAAAFQNEPEYRVVSERVATHVAERSRPRLLIAKLGQDGHDRGANVIASAFSDLGFAVVRGPLFQTPEEAAELALSEKVQVIGVSSLAAGHKTLLPRLVEALRARDAGHVIVVCGGIVPRQDHDVLHRSGVAAVFGPGTHVLEAAHAVLDLIEGRKRNS